MMYLSFADRDGIFSFNSFNEGVIGFFLTILNKVSGWFSLGTYLETLSFSDKLLNRSDNEIGKLVDIAILENYVFHFVNEGYTTKNIIK